MLSAAWLDKNVSSVAALKKLSAIEFDSGIVIHGWQLQMSLEIRLQQIPLKFVRGRHRTFKNEFAARKQAFDLVADVLFKPAGVEKSAGPSIPGPDALLATPLTAPD